MTSKAKNDSKNKVNPSVYADQLGIHYTSKVNQTHKKNLGQFFTPISIANLMASYSKVPHNNIKILDPGCGTAVLSCALIEHLIKNNKTIRSIKLVVYETDTNIIPFLKKSILYLQYWLQQKQIKFNYNINNKDFVLTNAVAISKLKAKTELFDIIISNPPYFKLPKTDKRVNATKKLVSGQTNIYSLFMGISTKLLKNEGELIYIVPRSFASGNYFKLFREFFLNAVQIQNIHLFESRKDTFQRDNVLQETLILKATKFSKKNTGVIKVSSSNGLADIKKPTIKKYQLSELIDMNSNEKIIHLPTNNSEISILELVNKWEHHLSDFNISISTGPVVYFRSTKFITSINPKNKITLAPLFWLHNVTKMVLKWPLEFKDKGQFIRIENGSKSQLIPNKNYIFLRRFSTKDDKSRLIAAPYFCSYQNSDFIGVENKLNYIYRKNGHLLRDEAVGICALLNSILFDKYFQTFNGNVNVSATEIREMKFPPLNHIKKIGNKIIISNDFTLNNINKIINKYFSIKP